MVDHVDGGCKERFDIGVAGGISDGLGKEGFAGSWVTDEDDVGVPVDKVEVEQIEDGGFLPFSA